MAVLPDVPTATSNGLVVVKNNAMLMQEEAVAAAQEQARRDEANSTATAMGSLANHIWKCWEKAKRAKIIPETIMLRSLRQRNGEYEPSKLAAIKALGGAEVYMMLTDIKCRTAEAWLKDILLTSGERPWDISPTPIPELPEELAQQIKQRVEQESMRKMAMGGQPIDPAQFQQEVSEQTLQLEAIVINELFKAAKTLVDQMASKIEDQFAEGNWRDAVNDAVFDLVTMKAGIVKGPVYKKVKKLKRVYDSNVGGYTTSTVSEIIPHFERRSPLDIYPEPGSSGINDGYLIDLVSLSPKDLTDLIGVPGYKESAIRTVLQQYRQGGLREWTNIMTERAHQEQKDSVSLFESNNIDCIEFHGSVSGAMLKEWGIKDAASLDSEMEYDIVGRLVGREVISAVMNPNPLGEKIYSKASLEEIPGAFWGKGLPELIFDIQGVCNAVARAIVNNVGIASGPQVEVNQDKVDPTGSGYELTPWKVWLSTGQQMNESPAVRYYMPPMVAEKLVFVYKFFSQLADEQSGIPAYAHGDAQVGGAGNTASGLSMLMGASGRGIKVIMGNLDRGIIETTVSRMYYSNLLFENMRGEHLVGDVKIIARGSSSIMVKEQQALRRNEFIRNTANPFDMQIMGIEGRRELLKELAKSLDLDVDKVVPEIEEYLQGQQGPQPGQPGQPGITSEQVGATSNMNPNVPRGAPVGMDMAGNVMAGRDTNTVMPR